jgi:hypothetical protein
VDTGLRRHDVEASARGSIIERLGVKRLRQPEVAIARVEWRPGETCQWDVLHPRAPVCNRVATRRAISAGA